MKIRTLLPALLVILILTDCKKGKLFDYRRKYTGNYTFNCEKHMMQHTFPPLDSTYTFESSGKVEFSTNEVRVKITFGDNLFVEPEIDKNGKFLLEGGHTYSIEGEFSTKKTVSFVNWSGGLGGGTTFTVTGKKK